MTIETITADPDQEALIAAMMQHAEKADEPGDMRANDILHRSNEEFPAPVLTGSITSAGYVTIYDTKTGEPSLTNRNMLPTQLKKLHEDGTRAFTINPRPRTRVGRVKCFLHPDDADRAHYDELGFGTCKKANLLNKFQRDLHMKHRHKEEWAAIVEERKQAEKEDDRAFQRKMATDMNKRIKAAKA